LVVMTLMLTRNVSLCCLTKLWTYLIVGTPQGPNRHPPPAANLDESDNEVEVYAHRSKSGKFPDSTYTKHKVSTRYSIPLILWLTHLCRASAESQRQRRRRQRKRYRNQISHLSQVSRIRHRMLSQSLVIANPTTRMAISVIKNFQLRYVLLWTEVLCVASFFGIAPLLC